MATSPKNLPSGGQLVEPKTGKWTTAMWAWMRDLTTQAAASGPGDVVGPASSTDNAIARFDGVTGKLIQNSGITIADGASGTLAGSNSGDVTLAGTPDYITIAGQIITRALINLATHVTGRLLYANLTAATAASRLFGRGSASGSGDWQEITLGSGVALTGTVLSATGSGGTVTAVTGTPPIASSGGTTPVISLNDTAVTPGTYGDATNVGQFTVDQKGRITFAANVPITASGGGGTLIGIDRLLGDGATTAFSLPDLAEYLIDASDAGLIVDPTLYALSADRSQIVFATAPTSGHVLTFEYAVAQS